jgi:hypothetical protein
MADVLGYVLRLADVLGVDLTDALRERAQASANADSETSTPDTQLRTKPRRNAYAMLSPL